MMGTRLTFLLACFAASVHLANAADSLVDVDRDTFHERAAGISATSFEELSAHLYGGDTSYASKLRELNASPAGGAGGIIKYPKPRYRVARGDTFQKVGAFWAGGSAFSYRQLLELNPQIQNPNALELGTWVYLPRIPSAEEQARWKAFWYEKNEPGLAQTAKPEDAPNDCAKSAYEPKSEQERYDLVEWLLEHKEVKKDRARADALVQDLVSHSATIWKSNYLAGRYFLETERPDRAAEYFSKSLLDQKAPVQAGVFFVKARERANRPLSGNETDLLQKRYPRLRSILAEMK